MGAKRCAKCGADKALSEFYVVKRRGALKPSSRCRACVSEDMSAYYWRDPELTRARCRERYRANLEKMRAYNLQQERKRPKRTWAGRVRTDSPEKTRARYAVSVALKRGDLTKPTHCQDCGAGPLTGRALQAHHANYLEPLHVQWLCIYCHAREHRQVA